MAALLLAPQLGKELLGVTSDLHGGLRADMLCRHSTAHLEKEIRKSRSPASSPKARRGLYHFGGKVC